MRARSSRPHEPLGYGRQYVDQDDVDAVAAVLLGEPLTQGPAVARFEAGLVAATGAPHAVAVANGTCALHLAYHALGVGPGRGVVTTANTFLATATAAQMCGGAVEFLDIDPSTGNLDVHALEQRLERGAVPDVVSAVHFAGLPCDMQGLIALKRRHGFDLVEDAAHALGARYQVEGKWYRVGEHPEIDATILSFHPVKHVTTGEGGAVLTHDAARAAKVRRLRSHGVDTESTEHARPYLCMSADEFAADGRHFPWYKPMVELGFNYRLSDIQAALGTSQLKKLPDFLEARREIAQRYTAELRGYELLHPFDGGERTDREHAWHLFVIRCPAKRESLIAHLRERGIHTQVHYYPVPLQPWFLERGSAPTVPNALAHARTALSLPIYPSLSEEDQGRVIAALSEWRRERLAA